MNTYGLWKRSAALFLVAGCLAVGVPLTSARAQAPSGPDTTSSTTEDSTGKVTAVTGTTISLTSRRGPFTYRFAPDVHIIGPDTEHLKIADLHAGQEATIYYYQRDGEATAARIVVLKTTKKSGGK